VSRVSGLAMMAVAGVLLAGAAAGCSSAPTAKPGSVTSCFQFAAGAIQRHITVTEVPAACQGLSQVQINVVVSRALHAAAAGVRGKVRQLRIIARDSAYVAHLIRVVPESSPPAVAAPSAVAVSSSRPPSRSGLSLAALAALLVTVGLGVSMMARWITHTRRRDPQPRSQTQPRSRPGRGAALNFAHLGLALTGLLVWISYLATGVTGLAWAACGLLLAGASLGMTLVFLATATTTAPAARPEGDPPPAGRPPVLIIAVHITAACVTILLVTLAAIGYG
jgi:manganese efflux pump family protein